MGSWVQIEFVQKRAFESPIPRIYFLNGKMKKQYDEFLHKIQQPKMKELWDNKEDAVWEKMKTVNITYFVH